MSAEEYETAHIIDIIACANFESVVLADFA